MHSTLTFHLSQKPRSKKILYPTSQGTTPKFKMFLEEHAQLMQLSPLSKLLTDNDKCHFPKFNFHESPVATKINSFENEESILNRLVQTDNTPERDLDDIDNVCDSLGKKWSNPVHKNGSVLKLSHPSPQTSNKYSNGHSVGTRKLERFLQQKYSKEPRNKSPSNVTSRQKNDTKNTTFGLTNNLTNLTNETPKKNSWVKNSFGSAKINSFVDSTVSSTIVRRKRTLLDYFKETKTIKRSLKTRNATKASTSNLVCLGSSSSDSGSNFSDDDDFVGCARTRNWPKKKLDILGTEDIRNDNKCARNIVALKKKNEYKSPLFKGLECVEEFDKQYNKTLNKNDIFKSSGTSSCSSNDSDNQRTYPAQKLNQWLKNKLNNDRNNDLKNRSCNNVKKTIIRKKTSKSVQMKARNSKHINSDRRFANFNKQFPTQKIRKAEPTGNNVITKYLSKNKSISKDESFSCNLGKKSPGSVDNKNKEIELTQDKNTIKIDTNSVFLQSKRPTDNEESFKNAHFRKNWRESSEYEIILTKKSKTNEKILENIVKGSAHLNYKPLPERNTQKNLYSSEGFFESMSLESPMIRIDDDTEREKTEKSHESGLRKKNSILNTEEFKKTSTFIQSLCSQPQKLAHTSERKKLTPSEERELSPSYYVMKMCGPESEAMVNSILTSHTNDEKDVNSWNFNKNDKRSLNNSLNSSIDHKNFNTIEKNIRSKDIPSVSVLFENFSQNMNRTQMNEEVWGNSQITQKKDKFDSQTLKNLYKLHESNSWQTQEQAEQLETSEKQYFFEKNVDPTQLFTKTLQEFNQNEELQFIPKGVVKSNFAEQGSADLNWKPLPERKTQKNLYSNEGYFESMSLESPMIRINDNKMSYLSIEKDSTVLKTENFQETGFKKKNSIRNNEKFKETSTFIHSLCSQPQKLSQTSKRRKLTPSEERELSPSYYVMKMCGPESEAMVNSILTSHTNKEKDVNSWNFNKNDKRSLSNSLNASIDHKKFNTIEKNIRSKDIPSDSVLFENFSQNMNCTQINKTPMLKNEEVRGKSQITQKKEKFDLQTLDNLYKLHESNSWQTQEEAEQPETLKKQYFLEKNFDPTQSFMNNFQEFNQNEELQFAPKGVVKSNFAEQKTQSSEIFGTQDNFCGLAASEYINNTSLFPTSKNTKVNNSHVTNLKYYAPTYKGGAPSPSQNTHNDQFLQKLLSQHFKNAFLKNCKDVIPEKVENIKNLEYITNNSQRNVGHIHGNCKTVKNSEGHNKTNNKELEKNSETQREIENILGTQTEIETGSMNLKKTYNLSKDCLLYEDNLLKSLVEDEGNSWKTTGNKQVIKSSAEESKWGRSYIKRYKKGSTKIFKMKRRIKKKKDGPPENLVIDKFLKKLNNNFEDESPDKSASDNDESVSTPVSYKTDETKSEVLSTGSSKLTNNQKLLRQGINILSKDKSLLFSRFEDHLPHNFDKNEILANIQHILNTVLDDFKQGKEPVFRVPKEAVSNCFFADGRYQMREPPEYTKVCYKSHQSRPKFNLILFLLNKIKKLLETDAKLTKREIYYQLKTIIASQGTTDRALKDISKMLNVGMWALNITAQKGLVYGNLKVVMADGETLNCNVPGTLIPYDISKICEIQSTAYFILVVEKEAIFHKLLEENLPNKLTRPFILITGKGYPDLNTQLFLKKLWMIMSIPVFILVDADPDGISIMLTYRFGSIANAHVSQHLAIPKAKWLGVFPTEISRLTLAQESLSKREISMTQKLLQLECVRENEKIKMQLEELLENGIKTGIEGLVKTHNYLSDIYLSWKFFRNNLI